MRGCTGSHDRRMPACFGACDVLADSHAHGIARGKCGLLASPKIFNFFSLCSKLNFEHFGVTIFAFSPREAHTWLRNAKNYIQ